MIKRKEKQESETPAKKAKVESEPLAKKNKFEKKSKEKSEQESETPTKTAKIETEPLAKKKKFEKKSKAPKKADGKGVKGPKQKQEKPEDWNAFKKEKKELRMKRKQAKTGFEVIAKAKQIGEKLRCKTLKGGEVERNKLINELHSLLKGKGHYEKFVLAHDTARVIQWLLKYSSDIIKKQISEELAPVTVLMLQSKYGNFCVKRLLKYGNTATRAAIINKMYGNAVKLAVGVVSAPVFEYAYSTWATPQQKHHLVQEFFGEIYRNSKDNKIKHIKDIFEQSPDLKTATLSATKANLSRIIDKNLFDSGLVQTVLNQFLSECSAEDRADLISQLIPHIVVISNSKDGARAAMQCIWHGTNKDRKQAMKTIKENVIEMAKHEHAHCTIIALLDTADDTVLLHKVILSEILKEAKDLAVNEWGRKVLLWLVAPADPTCFHPLFFKEVEEGRNKSTSKKDVDIRRKEILEYSIDTLVNLVSEEPEFWLKNSSLAYEMLAIVKASKGNWFKKTIESITKVIVDPEWKVKNEEEEILGVEDAGMHLVLKKLAKNDQELQDKEFSFGSCVVEALSKETIKLWLSLNRGCFLMVFIYENGTDSVQKNLKLKLKKHKSLLEEQKSAGSNILRKKIN